MHTDHIKGYFKKIKGNVMQIWGRFTFDPFDVAAGKSEFLSGQIQESHGIAMETAKKDRITWGTQREQKWQLPPKPRD
jgi:uncharacterized protein YjbJ (UPF0337 family)